MELDWCLARPNIHEPALTVDRVSCDSPHTIEVFAMVNRPTEIPGPYPGEEEARIRFRDTCERVYMKRFGAPSIDDGLGLAVLAPLSESYWNSSDARLVCGVMPLTFRAERGNILERYQSDR